VDFCKKNCENCTQDIYEKVSSDLGSGPDGALELKDHLITFNSFEDRKDHFDKFEVYS
jgi:hypothetical protein